MFDVWGAEDVFAADEGCFPDFAEGPSAFMSSADEGASDDGSLAGELWGLAVTALAGAAAYAGVRRLLDRDRRGDTGFPAGTTSAPASQQTAPHPAQARTSEPVPAPVSSVEEDPPETASQSEESTLEVAQLVAELIALYDLEPNDTLRRRIVRSLSKVEVRIDEESDVAFDAERHDVMGTVPAEAGMAPGTVVEVVRPGFVRAAGQVVRATEVVVAADVDGAW